MSLFWGALTISSHGARRYIGLGIIVVIGLLLSLRPSFVLPKHLINTSKMNIERACLFLFGFCILLLSLDIHIKDGGHMVESQAPYIEIVLDVSLSMSAKDVEPSRFIVAQQTLDQLLSSLDNAKVGVIIFSWIPFVHIPFSNELGAVRKKLQKTTLADFPPTTDFLGTAMGDALFLALDKIEQAKAPNATIVLISDGGASQWIDPIEVAAMALKRNIPIHTIAIGQEMAMLGVDNAGNKVIASLDSNKLEEISKLTHWSFYRITDAKSIERTRTELLSLFRNDKKSEFQTDYFPLNRLLIPLLLLCATIFFAMKIILLFRMNHALAISQKKW